MASLKSHFSEVHNTTLWSLNSVSRLTREKDILKKEKETSLKGYSSCKFAWTVHFPRASWLIMKNPYYNSTLAALKRGHGPIFDRISEIYVSESSVPLYSVLKEGRKIGNMFYREDINEENYLFMPKGGGLGNSHRKMQQPSSIGKDGKKNWSLDVSNDYYFFDLHKNGNIIEGSRVWYKKRS